MLTPLSHNPPPPPPHTHSAHAEPDLGHDSAASHLAGGGRGGQGQAHGLALAATLPHQERTLRALLQKAKMVLAQQSQQQLPPPPPPGQLSAGQHQQQGEGGFGLTRHLGDSELVRINTQLQEATAGLRPGGWPRWLVWCGLG